VRALPFVREVKSVESKLIVTLEDPDRQNPEMIRTLVNAGADVVFVGELRHSLEDVYLQLVKNA
jgi:ABC-2 type transport system ATP-binding protein